MKVRVMSELELHEMSTSILDDVCMELGEEEVAQFFLDNRKVAAAFISCTWVRVRTYLHIRTKWETFGIYLRGAAMGWFIGIICMYLVGK